MPKRNRDTSPDNIQYYRQKIKKLEEQQRFKRRRIFIESSSDSDDSSVNSSPMLETSRMMVDETPSALVDVNTGADGMGDPDGLTMGSAPATEAPSPDDESETCPELDPDLLVALGEETGNDPKFGDKIHRTLAQRWDPILKKGLLKEAKDKLFKEYLVPENCTLLQAPKLNREVAAAVSEASRQRDKRKETEQQQLGVGITAINKALTLMLTSENKLQAIKIISDGCRILTDLHYQETQARIQVINYALAKPFLNIIQDSERDETLYGNKLAEKIKASKTIEKQGLSIKKFIKMTKNAPTTEQAMPSSTRSQYQYRSAGAQQGNWSGPSRFQQNRGGRRGSGRTNYPVTSRRPPPQQQSASATGPNKQRHSATRQ